VLGRSVGHTFDPAARVSGLAGTEAVPLQLPRILRAGVALDRLAEAVCALHGVAVVLPVGAPTSLTAPPAPSGRSWRRSRRLPWRAALHWIGDVPGLALALDLAPSERLADRLLARRVLLLPDAARRTPAIKALGAARFAAALRLRPAQEDASGRLHQVGRAEDPSVFVVVRDSVL
jgi:hypothetical protein